MRAAAILIAALGVSGQTAPTKYAEGQVWEYHVRPQDAGSLLKIQRITALGDRPVYHLSIIGIHFAKPELAGVLPHIPVSKETLDNSVTKPSPSTGSFPPASVTNDGIAQWQHDQGGVFTIPVSEIVDIVDKQFTGDGPKT